MQRLILSFAIASAIAGATIYAQQTSPSPAASPSPTATPHRRNRQRQVQHPFLWRKPPGNPRLFLQRSMIWLRGPTRNRRSQPRSSQDLVASNEKVARQPAPQVYFSNVTGGVLNFELRAWTDHFEDLVRIRSDLALAINAALVKENLAA